MKGKKEKRKRRGYHQPAAAAKNLLHLTAAINPTKRVKRSQGRRRNPQRKRPFSGISYARFRWNPPRLILPQGGKGDKHDRNRTQSHLLFVRRRRRRLSTARSLTPPVLPAAMEALTATDKCFSPARAMSPMPILRPPTSPEAAR